MVVSVVVSLIALSAFAFWFDSLFEEPEAEIMESLDEKFPVKSVLVVLAHPDDEIFVAGMLVKLKLKLGTSIKLICATGGEGGFKPYKNISDSDMIMVRHQELVNHCRLLGINDLEVLKYRDGKLSEDYPSLLKDLVAAIRTDRPDMLLTFDPECGYTLHPDHLAVGRAVTEAISRSADHLSGGSLDEPFLVRWLACCVAPAKIMKHFGGPRGTIIAKKQRPAQYAVKIDKMIKVRGWQTHKSQSSYLRKVWKIPPVLLYAFFDKEHYIITESNSLTAG